MSLLIHYFLSNWCQVWVGTNLVKSTVGRDRKMFGFLPTIGGVGFCDASELWIPGDEKQSRSGYYNKMIVIA
jgi:hypothetical protein